MPKQKQQQQEKQPKKLSAIDAGELIAIFPRGAKGEIRVSLQDYKGKMQLSIRLWANHLDGILVPTQRGCNFEENELQALADALTQLVEGGRETVVINGDKK